jgi:flavorubredoxin
MLSYMKGLRPMNKLGAAFGSYGWKDTIVKMLNEALEEMKFEIIDPGISVQYVPTEDDLNRCAGLGEKVKKAVLGR